MHVWFSKGLCTEADKNTSWFLEYVTLLVDLA
jgi:hypothetical protein